ncbi:MAG: hypothetical protein IKC02_03640 [Oscillospiraceae bacterium]|nr:hypothetical protein [Oscillospiraceae bacterium]
MGNYEVLESKICQVRVNDEEDCIDADISIVYHDGLYGLMHTSKIEGSRCGDRDDQLLLPLKYDNLFFIDIDKVPHVATVQRGKQGLCRLQCRSKNIFAKQLLPPIYDSIHFGEKTGVLFLHKKGIISCFSIYEDCVFATCESYKELCDDYLLCTKETDHTLWYTADVRLICHPQADNISFLGSYKHDLWWAGSVFLLKHKKQNEVESSQLLFCEDIGEGFYFSPIATKISVHTKSGRERCELTQIDMSFGNREDTLTEKIVNAITKETDSF